jgi:hypothetical protein
MFARPFCFVLFVAGFMLMTTSLFSQDDIPVRDDRIKAPVVATTHKLDLGFGLGMDYGGLLGIQFGFAPVEHLTLFAAGGYYVLGFGWQLGVKGLFLPKTTKHVVRPFLKAMYGTNSLILVDGTSLYDKMYSGFTAGFGLEFRFGKQKKNGFDVDLNVPLRTPEYWDDWNTLKNDPAIDVIQEPLPVAISIGFHHEF